MSLSNVILQIEKFLPNESEDRILLVAKIIRANRSHEMSDLISEQDVRRAISQILSLDEQLSATAMELDGLAATTPSEFEPSHIWTLIRTIKVQSQMLDLIYHPKDLPTTSLAETSSLTGDY